VAAGSQRRVPDKFGRVGIVRERSDLVFKQAGIVVARGRQISSRDPDTAGHCQPAQNRTTR
jgi:hypothetical protein